MHTSTSFLCIHQLRFFFVFFVGRHVGHHLGHIVGTLSTSMSATTTLCEVSGTLTEWKSESVMEVPFELTRSTFGHCPNRDWTIYTSTITFISINVFAQMLLRRLIWSQRRHDTAESEAGGRYADLSKPKYNWTHQHQHKYKYLYYKKHTC